jgi:beta-lactamase superfamily II metal-dependent hydrolase
MDTLRVRVYDVRFGDAILVSVPERENGRARTRRILIDVGNVLSGSGGDDAAFEPVVRDILAELGGDPLDLYVMTHEHMDHIQGLPHAAAKLRLELPVDYAWLTASAEGEKYYERHPGAETQRRLALEAYEAIQTFLAASPGDELPSVRSLMLNNNPRRTADCVAYLRSLARKKTTYVHREKSLRGAHPFKEAKLDVWAPEEDTSVYYGRFQPMALGAAAAAAEGQPALTDPKPPPGVDAQAFYNLIETRRRGYFDNLLAIDRAANDSSIVFSLEWRGWRLLFPGDAEHRSWKEMAKRDLLRPVHFLKISHHGSWNGTPAGELLDEILPPKPRSKRPRFAAVSTCLDTYDGVPDQETLDALAERATVRSVLNDIPAGRLFLDVEFEA